jgi:hypothetical protein
MLINNHKTKFFNRRVGNKIWWINSRETDKNIEIKNKTINPWTLRNNSSKLMNKKIHLIFPKDIMGKFNLL